jgi:hypothetical protein
MNKVIRNGIEKEETLENEKNADDGNEAEIKSRVRLTTNGTRATTTMETPLL